MWLCFGAVFLLKCDTYYVSDGRAEKEAVKVRGKEYCLHPSEYCWLYSGTILIPFWTKQIVWSCSVEMATVPSQRIDDGWCLHMDRGLLKIGNIFNQNNGPVCVRDRNTTCNDVACCTLTGGASSKFTNSLTTHSFSKSATHFISFAHWLNEDNKTILLRQKQIEASEEVTSIFFAVQVIIWTYLW